MKKIFAFVALFVGIGLVASAQENQTQEKKNRKFHGKFRQERVEKKSSEEIAKIRTERLDKELKFTDKQRAEVYAYNLEQTKKFRERAEVGQKQREAVRKEFKADHDKFKSLLTPEQQEILASKVKANREKMSREGRHFKDRKDGERPMRRKMEKKPTAEGNSNS
ncbi:MAG TPA: hypothetical protein PKA53_08425 [Sphingobacterium sp.]|nr:hypothetical protein [Sphingobacterium sp.]